MSLLSFTPSRPLATLCTAALVSLGACSSGMMGGMTSADMSASLTAVAANQGEVEEAQLALSRATSDPVRQFAQRMVSEHTPLLQRDAQMVMQMHSAMGTSAGVSGSASAGGMGSMGASANGAVSADVRAMLMSNPSSARLVQDHMQAMQRLQAASGADFDRAYMQRQVQAHQMVLSQLDALMPGVTNPQLRSNLMQERPAVAAHLQMAQQITASMGSM